MAVLDNTQLNETLRNVGARWTAARPAQEHHLGFVPGPEDHSLEERVSISRANHAQFMAVSARAAAPPYPAVIDWQKYPAHPPLPAGNYVTDVKDQKSCGSCVAFGTLAAFESAIRIHAKNPAKAVDLSEADLFYCHGRRCDSGWWPNAALTCCQNPGVVDEPCFPYIPGDQPCKRCADWETRLTKISKWHTITNTTDMKLWLASKGPLTTGLIVYSDFQSYHSGVYHHVSGAPEGGHCICCVGYNDAQRYWICKNSWGPEWGEHGFVNIAYGEVGVDAVMWALEI